MATTVESQATPLAVDPTGEDSYLKEDSRRLADAVSELVRVVQFRDRDRVCCYDVSAAQCYALRGIVGGPGLTVNELSAYLFVDKSTASRLANALTEKGYAVRHPCPEDGRIVRLCATERGRVLYGSIRADEERDYGALMADLSPATREEVLRLVGRVSRCFASAVDTTGGSCCVVR